MSQTLDWFKQGIERNSFVIKVLTWANIPLFATWGLIGLAWLTDSRVLPDEVIKPGEGLSHFEFILIAIGLALSLLMALFNKLELSGYYLDWTLISAGCGNIAFTALVSTSLNHSLLLALIFIVVQFLIYVPQQAKELTELREPCWDKDIWMKVFYLQFAVAFASFYYLQSLFL